MAAGRKSLIIRFQKTPAPNTLFVDRGPGFWATNSGKITGKFKAALQENHLKTYYKDDAGMQPGNLREIMLHETAVSWIKRRAALSRMPFPWEETPEQFATLCNKGSWTTFSRLVWQRAHRPRCTVARRACGNGC